jgi:hypothetical protein
MKKMIFATCLVALLAAAPAVAQVDLSNYVALGDSLTAGFASGSLMNWYQDRSYPALLARQAGSPVFEQPIVSEPGIPAILELVNLVPSPVIQPVSLATGLPTNAEYPYPYNNLGIPGANLFDMIFQTGDITNLLQGNFDTVMFDIVLRNGINTALEQAIGLQPTFMTVWIGNNDSLGAAIVATPIDGVTLTPIASFESLYGNAIGALVTNTTADIVLINLPHVTAIPFVTTVPPFVDIPGLGPTPLMGSNGPLTADSLVTLPAGALIAQGYGLPGGPPLPEDLNLLTGEPGYVLRPEETAMINSYIDAYNQIIAGVADTFGLPVMDANGFFEDIADGTEVPIFGGIELSTDFLLGGIFSYDGVHPQNIGYALITNYLIQTINAEFGATIPEVNMADVLFEGDWQAPGVSPAKASEVVMSKAAFDQLLKLFPPKLDQAPRIRRPSGNTPSRSRQRQQIRPRIQ